MVRNNTKKKNSETTNEGITMGDVAVDGNNADETIDSKMSLFEQICYGISSVGKFIYQNSYIFTNILMMV